MLLLLLLLLLLGLQAKAGFFSRIRRWLLLLLLLLGLQTKADLLVHPAAVLKLISSARPRFLFDFVGGALFTYSAWAKSARAVKLL